MRGLEERGPDGTESESDRGDRGPIRLALVANHACSLVRSTGYAYERLQELEPKSVVLLRRPRMGKPGAFETVMAHIAVGMGFDVEWFEPEPGGRDQTYRRDFELVGAADRVEAFFVLDRPLEGGTGHVVEAAIAKGVAVNAWGIDPGGQLVRIGEWEGDGLTRVDIDF